VAHTNGSLANERFSYDANGNRTGTTGTDDRLSTDGTYDDEGNLTVRTKISDGRETLYAYDDRNRLTEVDSKPADDGSERQTHEAAEPEPARERARPDATFRYLALLRSPRPCTTPPH
jgi:YD repeat-containing protein